ncbi:uncharacterized protein BO80DRAFT_450990 [Aspergillus ibericus CBS 121593]|uniref:Secreted protein n=1 Tax=Aspergillus ibericus CBS 121593 TaxID=1448316 RepID=A0A395HFL0_9EURO|nr:hypothetical protein BO80DRAFT_450990 [Aspergillus ibericus CBS 121593]RAL06243.1 hypothetical protein BO80DRAFT_450990 [Aspergillus ibericus CBS 121593]
MFTRFFFFLPACLPPLRPPAAAHPISHHLHHYPPRPIPFFVSTPLLRVAVWCFFWGPIASPLALPVALPEEPSHSGFKGRKGDGREANLAAAGVLLSNQNHPSCVPLCNPIPPSAHRLQVVAVLEFLASPLSRPGSSDTAKARKDIACFRRVAPCLRARRVPLALALSHPLVRCMEASRSAFEAPRGLGIGW